MIFLEIKQKHRVWLCILFDFSHMELYEQRFSFIMMFSKQVCFKASELPAMQPFGLPCLPGSLQIISFTAKTHKENGQVHTMFGNFLTFKCFGCSFNTVLNPFLFNLSSQVFCFFNLKRKILKPVSCEVPPTGSFNYLTNVSHTYPILLQLREQCSLERGMTKYICVKVCVCVCLSQGKTTFLVQTTNLMYTTRNPFRLVRY